MSLTASVPCGLARKEGGSQRLKMKPQLHQQLGPWVCRGWRRALKAPLLASSAGEVLVFLDSHCEVNVMWLQPLLAAIREDRRTVVCPVIDIISADTLAYSSSPVVRGGFNWGLHFKWDLVPLPELGGPEGATAPIK